ncbi:metallothionein-like protein type 2 [Primulina tabacum]|uniref:metallothionein-like protein type 2 n=1 Tax=Primulina tabacum TaxID=48773 RepID=UPI003F593F03
MSCCGGSCGCGPNCKCGNGCNGCGMYPDLSYSEVAAATPAQVLGFQKKHVEESEMVAAENGCKCGGNCNCSTCSKCN